MKKIDHNIQCKAHLRVQVGPLGPPGALEWPPNGAELVPGDSKTGHAGAIGA